MFEVGALHEGLEVQIDLGDVDHERLALVLVRVEADVLEDLLHHSVKTTRSYFNIIKKYSNLSKN